MGRSLKTMRDGFQSTPSTGRATWVHAVFVNGDKISIHALHGEGDNTDAVFVDAEK